MKGPKVGLYFLAFGLLLCACSQSSSTDTAINNFDYEELPHIRLGDADTLMTYSSEYPIGVKKAGDYLYVTKALTDTLVDVIDLATNQVIWQTARVGHGPDDVVSIDFISFGDSSTPSEFEMIDINRRSLMFIDPVNKKIRKEPLPDFVGRSTELALFDDCAISLKNNEEGMFSIHPIGGGEDIYVENDIDLGTDVMDKYGPMICNYALSAIIVPDDVNKRIMVAHYFFDQLSVYDFSGKLLSTTTLSGDSYSAKKSFDDIINERGHVAYPSGFGNADACYLTRTVYGSNRSEPISSDIIRVDWDGNPTAIIDIENPVIGKYDIDKDNNLYAVVKTVAGENEIYHILRWKLPPVTSAS